MAIEWNSRLSRETDLRRLAIQSTKVEGELVRTQTSLELIRWTDGMQSKIHL